MKLYKKINIKILSIIALIFLAIVIIRGQIILNNTKKITNIYYAVEKNQNFNMNSIDEMIYNLVKDKKIISPDNLEQDRVAYLATELYDMGGHSKCLKNLMISLDKKYQQKLFLSQINRSNEFAKNTILEIKNYSEIKGINFDIDITKDFYKNIDNLVNMIIEFKPKNLFVFIHQDDIISTAVLSLLQKHTTIKIIFFNHSFQPNLAMSFADLIIDFNKGDELITKNIRNLSNSKLIKLQSLKKDETIYYSSQEILKIRKDLGIKNGNFVSMSGASSYKFFDGNDSPYFKMIKSLLLKVPNLQHVILSEFNDNQKKIINDIFGDNKKLLERIIFVPYHSKYDIYFQSADVFIDSFPYIGPLTQIDLMRNKIATVVKDSPEHQIFSKFYQPPKYPYLFEDPKDIEMAVIKLLKSKKLRDEIIKSNYKYWLENHENSVVRGEFIKIIEQ
jgi:hypothetical protein